MTKRRRTDNTMAKRRRTDKTMAKRRRTDNTMAKRKRTDNTMAKRKSSKGQTSIYKCEIKPMYETKILSKNISLVNRWIQNIMFSRIFILFKGVRFSLFDLIYVICV